MNYNLSVLSLLAFAFSTILASHPHGVVHVDPAWVQNNVDPEQPQVEGDNDADREKLVQVGGYWFYADQVEDINHLIQQKIQYLIKTYGRFAFGAACKSRKNHIEWSDKYLAFVTKKKWRDIKLTLGYFDNPASAILLYDIVTDKLKQLEKTLEQNVGDESAQAGKVNGRKTPSDGDATMKETNEANDVTNDQTKPIKRKILDFSTRLKNLRNDEDKDAVVRLASAAFEEFKTKWKDLVASKGLIKSGNSRTWRRFFESMFFRTRN